VTKSEAARLNGKKGGRPRKVRDVAPVTPLPQPAEPVIGAVEALGLVADAFAAPDAAVPVTEPTPQVPVVIDNPFELTPRELLFVEAYCGVANFNACEAYRAAGFEGKPASVSANAARLIASDRVSKAVASKLATRLTALRVMDGEEALRRLTLYARADIGHVLPADHPIKQLPEEARLLIKSIRPGRYGTVIELHDSMKATELLAKAAGALKETVKVEHSLAELMAMANAVAQSNHGAAA
jgi:hypothetical protein